MKRTTCFAVTVAALAAMISLSTDNALFGDEPTTTINPNTLPLYIERAKVVAEFGKEHPRARALDAQIKEIAKLPVHSSLPDVAKPAEADLRATVEKLVRRVEVLEQQVSELKARPPRTELLDR